MHRFVVCMVGLLMILAVVPVAGSGPDDFYYFSNAAPTGNVQTCHSDPGAQCLSGPGIDGFEAFHNDRAVVVTVWAENDVTGAIDYWQCIDVGGYSGNPVHHPTQGSINGYWVQNGPGTFLGDLDWQSNDYTYYWYEFNGNCFVPCDDLLLGVPDPRCILITPFKVDEPEK